MAAKQNFSPFVKIQIILIPYIFFKRRRKSSTPCRECHHHNHHNHNNHGGTLRRNHEHHHVHQHMSNTLRSKSTGQLLEGADHHIRGSTRSRSRSKSKLNDCNECCDNNNSAAGLSRNDRQSTRSTRWEVYRHVESPKKAHLNSSQRRKSPIYKVSHAVRAAGKSAPKKLVKSNESI